MFYDLEDPNKFIKDAALSLHDDGIFVLEHADLLSIFKYSLYWSETPPGNEEE